VPPNSSRDVGLTSFVPERIRDLDLDRECRADDRGDR
jgi:hypothetical protein